MKPIKWFVTSLIIIFSFVAFVPVIAFPWIEKVNWESFALAYTDQPIEFNVNTIEDTPDAIPGDRICATASGLCSLRAAITESNLLDDYQADVIIDLPSGIYVVGPALPYAEYALWMSRESLSRTVVRGHGASDTIISGAGTGVFDLSYSVTFSDVTIADGLIGTSRAGAFFIRDYSDLLIKNSIIRDHYGVEGGAINTMYPNSFVTLENTSIFNNIAQNAGGAIYSENGTVVIRNSAIYDNEATNGGGAIYSRNGSLIVVNSTISGNTASSGGGLLQIDGDTVFYSSTIFGNAASIAGGGINLGLSTLASIGLTNTILAGNQNQNSPDCSVVNPGLQVAIMTNGHSLIGSTLGCSIMSVPTDIVDQNAMAGPLQNNGGSTFTHALFAGSPAINGGSTGGCIGDDLIVLNNDQRLFPRPSRSIDTRCDIGAYEWDDWPRIYLPIITR